MKKICLPGLLILLLLTGCVTRGEESNLQAQRNITVLPTAEGTATTACCAILRNIWENYRDEERFLVYGGDSQNFVTQGPGDLDVSNTAMLQQRFFLTEPLEITEGAALTHRLNPNAFCSGVFRLSENAQAVPMALQWKKNLDQTEWSGGQPQRYLIAQPKPGFLLIAYGQTRVLETFLIRMNQACPESQILVYQEIPQKIPPQALPRGGNTYRTERFWIHLPRLMT